jgi:hypothetical protein
VWSQIQNKPAKGDHTAWATETGFDQRYGRLSAENTWSQLQTFDAIQVTSLARAGEVRVDGELLTCQPANVLPMAQRYFLF